MFRNIGVATFFLGFFILLISFEAFALAEPKEPQPYGERKFSDDIDEPVPPDEPDMDGFEIQEPSIIEPTEPEIGNFDKDMDPAEPEEINEPALLPTYDKEPEKGE